MEYNDGDIAEDGAGNFMVYKYGAWHPSDETGRPNGPIDASSRWGAGARELPNGTVERVGPRGGVNTVASAPIGEEGVGKLTEGQGKAILYGGMMRGGEVDYQRAREEGYNPASLRNQAADIAGVIPFDGDFFGRMIRDDVSDRGRQAELRWAEGNLRQLTGAAATNPEIARVAAINFDRGNDQLAEQRFQTRADTYRGTRFAAGPGAAALDEYPTGPDGMPKIAPQTKAIGDAVMDSPEVIERDGQKFYAIGRGGQGAPANIVSRFGQDNEITDEEMTSAGYTYDHDTGLWLTPANPITLDPDDGGTPSSGGGGFGGDKRASGGIESLIAGGGQSDGYETALAQQRANAETLKGAGREYGITDSLTAPVNDELAYGAGFLSQGLGNIVRQATGRPIEVSAAERGAAMRDLTREQADEFAREHPGQNFAGQVLGGAAFGPTGAARTMVGRMVQGAGIGGAYGLAGADGSVIERLPEAGFGMALGAGAVPVVERLAAPAINALARPVAEGFGGAVRATAHTAGRVGNALGVPGSQRLVEAAAPNPLQSGINRFAARSPQQPDAMAANVNALRGEEIAPTFVDAINDGGRGTLRALATRQTPARQTAREFADGRAAGLQDRLSTQARRTISDDPRSPTEIRTEVSARRSAEGDQAFGAVRGEPITPEQGVIEALRAPALRPAIEEAATAALNRGDSQTANMLRQLGDEALDNPAGVQITVGMADRLSRSLNGRAEAFQRAGNNDQAASYFALAERLRGSARTQVPGYDEALNAYAADSRLLSASELGEQFMSMESDQFASAMARLSPDEQQIARAAARRAVERQGGTQGQAPGVAQRLSNGREQAARTTALVGDAAPVQRAMGAELQTVRNAQGINPAQGSPTSMNAQDAMGAAGLGRDVATGNVVGLASRAMNAIRSRGFSDREAQALVEAATDPARTDELVAMLAQRMSRREARNLARALRYQLTTSPQSNQQR